MATSYNEQLADRAAAHAIDLLRFSSTARNEILGFLRRLEVKLEARLRAIRLDKGGPIQRAFRLQDLLNQVEAILAAEYGRMADAHEKAMRGLARIESTHVVGGFRDVAVIADIELNVLSANQLRSIASNVLIEGAPSRQWWSRQAGDLRQRFAEEMREGVALGESIDDLVRRVRGRATGRRHVYEINGKERVFVEFSGGLMDTSTRHAEALVRTSVQAIASDARRSTLEENQDVVKGVVQISTLDTSTTVICIARAGKAWSLPDYEPIDHDIAYGAGAGNLHWNCRSVDAPLLRSWQELGIDLRDRGVGKRWSRLDGKVPGDFTFDDFLKRRSPAAIEQQLGKRAAELYRSGKLSLEDLVNAATGRPLSVAELEALAEAA